MSRIPTAPLGAMLREPLVQFLALGALIFALNAMTGPAPSAADKSVVVSAQRIAGFQADFVQREARQPSAAELQAYIDNWVDEEVLYRQALALGLEKGDRLIRRHLVQKMRYLLEDAHPLDAPSHAQLAAWLQAHPDRYGRPATLSFEHVFIDRAHADGKRRAAALLTRLRAGRAEPAAAGDSFPGPAALHGVGRTDLDKAFGDGFWAELMGLPRGRWQGPIRTRMGLHLVKITGRSPAVDATVESAGRALRADYREHARTRANAKALDALRARFDVRVEPSAG